MTDSDPTPSNASLNAHAWARFWRLMRWMMVAAIAAVLAALFYLHQEGGLVSVHMVIATVAGVGFTVLLGAALMLLVFMSAGSGHDDDVAHAADSGHAEDEEKRP